MFDVEVRRRDTGDVLKRVGTARTTVVALRVATRILHEAGACLFSAYNRETAEDLPFIEVSAEAFPFCVVILNAHLVDDEGDPMPSGSRIGPFAAAALAS